MPEVAEPSWTSLLPAVVAIALAFATRQVLLALLMGVITGGVVLALETGNVADLNFVDRFLIPSIGSSSYAQILLIYLWSLGGLIGIWERTGGARHFAETVGGRVARGPTSALVFGWLVGVLFHQGGTVSTVLAGTTVKPVADRHGVSHEELAYVVDSTASPVATVLAFNAWPAFVAALVAGTIPLLPDEDAAQRFFWSSIPFNFYGMLAVASTLLFSLGWLPWTGRRMRRASERARTTGRLDRPGAEPMHLGQHAVDVAEGYRPSVADFLCPIGVLLGLAIVPYVLFRVNWINEAFVACAFSAMLLARARGLSTSEVIGAFVRGCQGMTIGAIVLGLAVTLGGVAKELHTADYVVRVVGDVIPVVALPAALTLLCMVIAFATGTSWGTYAVIFPVAMPLAYGMNSDPFYLHVCFGAVLGGSVFGDQCSPISDTTILSSMFTGCDLMDHVTTQLPLALVAASLGAVLSTALVLLR